MEGVRSGGGYSIGFPIPDGYIPDLVPESPSYTAALTPVEYEKEKQIEKCRDIFESLVLTVNDPEAERIARTTKAISYHHGGLIETYQYIFELTQEMLLDEILSFKDVAFKEEQEWRLIARPRMFTVQGRDDRGKTPTKRYFRAHRGVLVPFLKLMSLKGKLPIVSIRSGPSVDRDRARASVKLLLKEYGFPEVEFDGSEIPVLL